MIGPEQQRLQRYLTGARETEVDISAEEWEEAAELLTRVSLELEMHSYRTPGKIGALTGEAVARAFVRSATGMTAKADELRRGGEALRNAANSIREAETVRNGLGGEQGERPSPLTAEQPMRPKDVRDQAERNAAIAAWEAEYARREREARQATNRMDTTYTESSSTLRQIHRENPPEAGTPTRSGGEGTAAGGPAPGGPRTVPGGGGGHVGSGSAGTATSSVIVTGGSGGTGGTGETGGSGGTGGTGSDGSGQETTSAPAPVATASGYGTPQGPGTPVVTNGQPGGVGASAGTPVSSAGAGAALGGLAVGGGLVASGSAGAPGGAPRGSSAGQNVKPIGATSSRGAASTLGRSAAAAPGGNAAGTGSPTRASGTGTGVPRGRTALGTPPSSAASAGGRGAPAAGTGRAGAGSAAGRGDRGRKRKNATSPVALTEDWEVDETEAGPGVLG